MAVLILLLLAVFIPTLHMAEEIDDFQKVESGVSDFFPTECSSLRKNGFVILKNRPSKIVEISTSATGKHGHDKVHIVAIDIFTGEKYEDICLSTHNIMTTLVVENDYLLINIDDGFLSLMMDDGVEKDDIKIPNGKLGKEIKDKFENGDNLLITVRRAVGLEAVVAVKPITK